MKFVEFGKNKKELSKIIVGLMRINQMTPKELAYLIDGAMDAGINAFDIADIYANGGCEALLGETLASRPDLREKNVEMQESSETAVSLNTAVSMT